MSNGQIGYLKWQEKVKKEPENNDAADDIAR